MADTSFGTLPDRLKRLVDQVEGIASRSMRRAGLISDQVLVLGTPVDTGRARGGWQASTGAPILVEPGEPDKDGSRTHARNRTFILSFKLGQDLFITNVVPYIEKLNSGTSKQAPEGFSTQAVAQAVAFLRRQRYLD